MKQPASLNLHLQPYFTLSPTRNKSYFYRIIVNLHAMEASTEPFCFLCVVENPDIHMQGMIRNIDQ